MTRRDRRFLALKAAGALSEAAQFGRAAAQQLTAAKVRVLSLVAAAETAGFIVQEDFSVSASTPHVARRMQAHEYAAAIQTAVVELLTLDAQVTSRLRAAARDLNDFCDK